jgi:GDPmannose 4,6-dehydratase
MVGSSKNYNILTKRFNFKIKIGGKKLVKKFYNSI